MKCLGCGKEFSFDDAAEEFNNYFDEDHDYAYEGWENYCAECAIAGQELDDEEGEEYGEIPLVCASCGGDYPLCAEGCKILED